MAGTDGCPDAWPGGPRGRCRGLWPQGGEGWGSVLGGRRLRSSGKMGGLEVRRPRFELGPAAYQLLAT